MPTYTIRANVSIVTEDPGDGPLEQLISIAAAVDRDAVEIGKFLQRYGVATSNTAIRDGIAERVREIVYQDNMELKDTADLERAAAIQLAIENWRLTLP